MRWSVERDSGSIRTRESLISANFAQPRNKTNKYQHKATMSAEEVAKAFVQHFYQAFDADATSLAGLYVSLYERVGGVLLV